MTLKANERSVHATITAHSQKNETRNGRQNRHCNLKWSSQVTFQRGHLTTHLNFDHSGFPFALQCQTRNGRQNRNRKWSPQVTFQRGHLTKIPISIRTTISNLIFWDLRCKDLNGLHRSLFKGVISQHTSTLTIQDCLLNSNVRIAFWISMIISSLIFSWMGCTTVSIWGVIGIRVNMLSTWSIWFIHEGDMTHSKMSFSIFPVTWLIHKTYDLWIRTGEMTHSKWARWEWHDSFENLRAKWLIPDGDMTDSKRSEATERRDVTQTQWVHLRTVTYHTQKSLYLRNLLRTHVIREMCTQVFWKICHEHKE